MIPVLLHVACFFFSSRRRHTRCYRDWSSDVCSSDLHREPSRDSGAALPPALSARALEQPARPPAGGARGLRHDRAEDRLLRAPDLARAAAARAGLRAGPRLGPTTGAPIACRHPRHVDLLFDAVEGFLEGDGHVVAEVIAPVGTLPPSARADAATEARA